MLYANSLNLRMRFGILIALTVTTFFASNAAAQATDKDYVIKLGYYNCDHMTAAPVGKDAGIFDELGLKVEVIGNAKVPEAMAAGQMDAGYIGFERTVRAFLKGCPIFVSAMNKVRIHRVIETAMEVFNNRRQKIATSVLNEVMLKVIEDYPPPALKGKFIKIKFVTQLPTHAPSFAFFCNFPQYVKEPYKRYLENQLRQHFKFTGVPIQIFMRKK